MKLSSTRYRSLKKVRYLMKVNFYQLHRYLRHKRNKETANISACSQTSLFADYFHDPFVVISNFVLQEKLHFSESIYHPFVSASQAQIRAGKEVISLLCDG